MTTREKAYKQNPHIAAMTDFLTQHEAKLKTLHKKYQRETGEKMPFLGFVGYVFENAQDLVIEPANN